MRAAIFSDSHGLLEFALDALKKIGQVDLILHAGDHYRDGLKLAAETGLPVKAVVGNCDYRGGGPVMEVVELSGRRVLLTHGHLHGVNLSHKKLFEATGENAVEAVVFGHTHVAVSVNEGGILLFNPGSITRPLDYGSPSYGILEIGEKGIVPRICRI
ncbi:MAG: Phosphodiesterase YfcE [Pelotomaculum sp. PtaU1.Bin035]|nr:MAG: Phosphodiesterase YfcE [Pelotomaculum sp. PtaU1.Bin035]